jgi:hypothetical protein
LRKFSTSNFGTKLPNRPRHNANEHPQQHHRHVNNNDDSGGGCDDDDGDT